MIGDTMQNALKAIIAGLVAGLGSIVTGLGDNKLSWQELVTAILATVVALGAVYGVSNKPPSGTP